MKAIRTRYLNIGLIAFFIACSPSNGYEVYTGEAQGTTFSIKHRAVNDENYSDQVDSILNDFDKYFSTYLEHSLISRFNDSEKGIEINKDFVDLWEKCWELYIESDGYFDPTLKPVIEAYSNMKDISVDTLMIEKALQHTGMPLISLRNDSLIKKDPNVRIDLNAVAQGYSVDILFEFLRSRGLKDIMVEVGGELRTMGRNPGGKVWKIGIDQPVTGERKLFASLKLKNTSMATSGNYRKFRVIDGRSIGHIINPKSGFPEESSLLSVSVLTEECYRADALATALMCRKLEDVIDFDRSNDDVSMILIYLQNSDTLVYKSRGIDLKEIN